MPKRLDVMRRAALVGCGLLALLLVACQREPADISGVSAINESMLPDAAPVDPASAPKRSSKLHYALGIVGYNYTDTGILDYSVNGAGAFNLAVSTSHSGGGKTACCFGWAPGMKLPMPIRIEWTRNEETWCRQTAMLTDPGPLEPTTLEVHFFPDRHIEVAITDRYSPPRVNRGERAGRDFRVGKDVVKEKAESMASDAQHAECRDGRFPIGVVAEREDRERRQNK
jgi:hypothetical protein